MVAIPSALIPQRALSSFARAIEEHTGKEASQITGWPDFATNPRHSGAFALLIPGFRETGLNTKELLSLRRHWRADFATRRNPFELSHRPLCDSSGPLSTLYEPAKTPLGFIFALMRDARDPLDASLPKVSQEEILSLEGMFEENPFFEFLSREWEKLEEFKIDSPIRYPERMANADLCAVLEAAGNRPDEISYWLFLKSAWVARRNGDPQEPRFLHYLALVLEALGHTQIALRTQWWAGDKFGKTDPISEWEAKDNVAQTALRKGDIEAKAGRPEEALNWYRIAELISYLISSPGREIQVYGKAVDHPEERLILKKSRAVAAAKEEITRKNKTSTVPASSTETKSHPESKAGPSKA
jgi:hypothetical protein